MSHEQHHGARLDRGQGWNSQNRMFTLEHQHDGNVVLYHGARALWATNTCGRETTHFEFTREGELRLFHHHNVLWSSGAQGAHRFSIQDDGNLVLYTHDNRPIWASNTNGQYSHSDKTEVNRRLEAREFLRSENGRFTFCVQTDGNLVIYDGAEGGRPIWASNTNGRHVTHLVLQSDGNLVLYDNQQAHWASNTCGRAVDQLVMQNDGNLVIYGPGHHAVWATNTCR